MGASEVIRKLLRIGSNGLYTRKNIPATSHQLAHLTGTSVEPQLGLKPIYLRGQLYPRSSTDRLNARSSMVFCWK
jgi:hypothetical protein